MRGRRLAVTVIAVAAVGVMVGQASAQPKSYAGGGGMVGVAQIDDYRVTVDPAASQATITGTVVNRSNAVLTNVVVTIWDNEWIDARTMPDTLLPGKRGEFIATIGGGPNWAWQASVSADVTVAAYSPYAAK